MITPSERKVTSGERREKEERREREKTPLIVDTLFRSNAQGQRTHSARANLSFFRKNVIIIMLNKYKMTKPIILEIIRNPHMQRGILSATPVFMIIRLLQNRVSLGYSSAKREGLSYY